MRLFAQPERCGDTWLEDMVREMPYEMIDTWYDSMRVGGKVLEVRIEKRWVLGSPLFVIEPVWGVDE